VKGWWPSPSGQLSDPRVAGLCRKGVSVCTPEAQLPPFAPYDLRQRIVGTAESFVYALGPKDFACVKIGFGRDPWVRMHDLQHGHPDVLYMVALMPGGIREERALHRQFAAHRTRPDGEWFRTATPVREWCLKWWLR